MNFRNLMLLSLAFSLGVITEYFINSTRVSNHETKAQAQTRKDMGWIKVIDWPQQMDAAIHHSHDSALTAEVLFEKHGDSLIINWYRGQDEEPYTVDGDESPGLRGTESAPDTAVCWVNKYGKLEIRYAELKK